MPTFRKKPVEIEAFQLPPEGEMCSDEMLAFLGQSDRDMESQHDGSVIIHTLEGAMTASPGDWIIKGVQGEMYPCKPRIFAATYDRVET